MTYPRSDCSIWCCRCLICNEYEDDLIIRLWKSCTDHSQYVIVYPRWHEESRTKDQVYDYVQGSLNCIFGGRRWLIETLASDPDVITIRSLRLFPSLAPLVSGTNPSMVQSSVPLPGIYAHRNCNERFYTTWTPALVKVAIHLKEYLSI